MAGALSHGAAVRPAPILSLQTPASLYAVSDSESVYGGRTPSRTLLAVIWGDFRPELPVVTAMAPGDAYVVQEADFLCRAGLGAARGGILALKGFDWRIVSLDETAGGMVRLRIERVHA